MTSPQNTSHKHIKIKPVVFVLMNTKPKTCLIHTHTKFCFSFPMKLKALNTITLTIRQKSQNSYEKPEDFTYTEFGIKWIYRNSASIQNNEGSIRAEGSPQTVLEENKRFYQEIPNIARQIIEYKTNKYLRTKYDWFWKNDFLTYGVLFSLLALVLIFFFSFLTYILHASCFPSIFKQYQPFFVIIFSFYIFEIIFLVYWDLRQSQQWNTQHVFYKIQYQIMLQNLHTKLEYIRNLLSPQQQNRVLAKIYKKLADEKELLRQEEENRKANKWWRNDRHLAFWIFCLCVSIILLILNIMWYILWPANMFAFWNAVFT